MPATSARESRKRGKLPQLKLWSVSCQLWRVMGLDEARQTEVRAISLNLSRLGQTLLRINPPSRLPMLRSNRPYGSAKNFLNSKTKTFRETLSLAQKIARKVHSVYRKCQKKRIRAVVI